jgi:hypothetical protein
MNGDADRARKAVQSGRPGEAQKGGRPPLPRQGRPPAGRAETTKKSGVTDTRQPRFSGVFGAFAFRGLQAHKPQKMCGFPRYSGLAAAPGPAYS